MRYEDWPARLAQFVIDKGLIPFEWRINDCATFAGEWVERCTGEKKFTPWYSDPIELRDVLNRQVISRKVSEILGEPYLYSAMASRGDIALVESDDREIPSLGVVCASHVAVPGRDGVLMISREKILESWKVN